MFALMIKSYVVSRSKSFLLLKASVNINFMSFLSLVTKNVNVFRWTSNLEARCLTLKKYAVTIYLSK